jgi:ubiquinone/menaquinone biosynthesis C-methylase UbiE
MLSVGRERVRQHGWSNVELVESDSARFEFPTPVNWIISSFAITLVPEYESVIHRGAESLEPGGHVVILDVKLPPNWLSWLATLLVLTLRPFGVSIDLALRHPWEAMKKHLSNVSIMEQYGGIAYIAVGERAAHRAP